MLSFAFDPSQGETPETLAKKRALAQAMIGRANGRAKYVGEGIADMFAGLAGGVMDMRANAAERAGTAEASKLFNGVNWDSMAGSAGAGNLADMPSGDGEPAGGSAAGSDAQAAIAKGIIGTAKAKGINPLDLATVISYETGGTFNPTQGGPRTKYGRHRGLIQFGEPQARQYGVNWSDPVGSQLGENGAVGNYLAASGVRPGMGLLDLYSAVNAGHVGRYNARDGAAGGAPGTVADKVFTQMGGHRAKAQQLLRPYLEASLSPGPPPSEAMAQPIPQPRPTSVFGVNGTDAGSMQTAGIDVGMPPPRPKPEQSGAFGPPVQNPMWQTPVEPQNFPPTPPVGPPPIPQPKPVITPAGGSAPAQTQQALTPEQQRQRMRILREGGNLGQFSQGMAAPQRPAMAPPQAPQPQAASEQSTPGPVQNAAYAPPGAQQTSMGGRAGISQLAAIVSNPFITTGQRQMAMIMLQEQLQVQQAERERQAKQADPKYQLELQQGKVGLEKTQIETDLLKHPKTSQPLTPEQRKAYGDNGYTDPSGAVHLPTPKDQPSSVQEYQFAKTQGFPGTYQEWEALKKGNEKGPPNSVQEYEYAKSQGFKGTYQDWEALKKDPEKAPASVQEYEYAKTHDGFKGTFQDWEASKKGGMSMGFDPATGQFSFQQGGNIKPMTENQSKDTVFATRAEGALKVFEPNADALAVGLDAIAGKVPFVGNYLVHEPYQQAKQAGEEYLAAILRKDSGASITEADQRVYGTVYLPQPGDGPMVRAQKKAARARAIDALNAGMTPQAMLAKERALQKGSQAPEKKRLHYNSETGELE